MLTKQDYVNKINNEFVLRRSIYSLICVHKYFLHYHYGKLVIDVVLRRLELIPYLCMWSVNLFKYLQSNGF